MSKSTPRVVLPLKDRFQVVQLSSQGKSARQIAVQLGVGRTQILNILKNRDEVTKAYEGGVPSGQKRKRKTGNEEVNELTLQWFTIARSKNIPVSGPMLQEKALTFAAEIGNHDFKASNGWLEAFRKRNGISFSCLSGESADVDECTLAEWKDRVPTLCNGFSSADVFNVDETGFYYRSLPDKSLTLKGEHCKGGKKSKERLTVMLCCSFTGEKLRPLVIGKAENPRCFRGVQKNQLTVTWKSNRKAWMTRALFQEWLLELDRKMGVAKRKIILFLDNASSHPSIPLQNIKLQFLPPNTTSCLQPLDQGIIRTFKVYYRKNLIRHVLSRIDDTMTASDICKCVHVLHAVKWVT
jgi:transposase